MPMPDENKMKSRPMTLKATWWGPASRGSFLRRVWLFFRYLNWRCSPFLACSRHGRCFPHSDANQE